MEINSLKEKTLIKAVMESGQDIALSRHEEYYWKFDNISINKNKNNDISFASFTDYLGTVGGSIIINRAGCYKMSGQVTVNCPVSGMFYFSIQEFKIDEEGFYDVTSTMLQCHFPVAAGENTFVLPESILNLEKGITINICLSGGGTDSMMSEVTVKTSANETFFQIESI